MNKSEVLTVLRIAYGGDGVCRCSDGKVCFVPGVLPGEEVIVRIVQEKRSFCRGEVVRILRPSAERIEPECPLEFPVDRAVSCRGCVYGAMAYPAEIRCKQQQFEDFLLRSHLADAAVIRPPVAAPQRFGLRNKLTLHGDPAGRPGFIGSDNQTVLPGQHCALGHPEINSALAGVTAQSGERVTLRYTECDGVRILREASGEGDEVLTEELPGIGRFRVKAGVFFQTNIPVAAALIEYVCSLISNILPGKLFELYCGVGVFSIAAARKVPSLQCCGVEIESKAIECAAANAAAAGVSERCRFDAGDAAAWLHNCSCVQEGDLILVDPPRSGLQPEVLTAICNAGAGSIIYVSCAPDTLCRDLRFLRESGYEIKSAGIFDMFPCTKHFESVVELILPESERKKRKIKA